MAFTAQTFRRLLSSRSSTLVQLQAIRDIMLMSIHTIDSTRDSDELSVLCCVLGAIEAEVEPIPIPTVDLQTGLQGPESHRKRCLSTLSVLQTSHATSSDASSLVGVLLTPILMFPRRYRRLDLLTTRQSSLYLSPPSRRQASTTYPDTLSSLQTPPTPTRPNWLSSSLRQCSACIPSVSPSFTQGAPSVVPVTSTRCLMLLPVTSCQSKERSDLPRSKLDVNAILLPNLGN